MTSVSFSRMPDQRRGGTLIDLTIASLVMGIMAAVAAPRFAATVSELRCEAAADRIAADLNHARKMAMFTSSTVTVTFTETPPGYMADMQHPHRPHEAYHVLLSDIDASVGLDQVGIERLSFNSYGVPVGLTSKTTAITLRTSGRFCSVVVDPASGEARVE